MRIAAGASGEVPAVTGDPLARSDVGAAAGAAGPEPVETAASGFAALTGRLVEPGGGPAAARRCRLWSFDPMTGFGSGVGVDGTAPVAGPQFLDATTDEHGVFAFDSVPPGGLHALWLAHDGPHATWRPLDHTPGPGERVDLGVLVLQLRASIAGSVVGPDGEPVVGAEVWAADLPGAVLRVAAVDRITPGGALMIALPTAAEGAPEVDGSLAATAAYAEALRRHLTAWVLQAEGDADFQMLPYPAWLSRLCAELPRPRTTTDRDGHFELGGVAPGDNVLVVRAPGLAHGGRTRVPVREGERREVGTLRLREGETLAALVVDQNGAPLPGAEVRVAARPRVGLTGILFADPARAADGSGRVAFDGLPRGDVVVAFRPAEGDPWVTAGPFDSDEQVELRLPPGRAAPLAVRSAAGEPLEELVVRLRQGPPFGELTSVGLQEPLDPARHVEVLGDDEEQPGVARVRLHDLVAGIYTLTVSASGHATATRLFAVGGETAVELELELAACVDASLLVVDADDRPIEGAEVYVRSEADDAVGWDVSLLQDYGSAGGWSRLVRSVGCTDARGEVSARGLPAGPFVVVARHRARGVAAVRVEEASEQVRVVLAAPGHVDGRLFEHGVPAVGERYKLIATAVEDPARVGAGLPDQEVRTRPAADGTFHFEGLTAGEWSILVLRRGGTPIRSQGTPGEIVTFEDDPEATSVSSLGELILAMRPTNGWGIWGERRVDVEVRSGETARIEFDVDPTVAPPGEGLEVRGVLTIDGRPAAGVELISIVGLYSWQQVETAFATTAADGAFVRTGIARQPFKLQFIHAPFEEGWVQREVEPGEAAVVDVALALRSARLQLEVIGFTGTPAAGHDVRLWSELGETGATFEAQVMLDERGRLDVTVPAGSYSISVEGGAGSGRLDGVAVEGATAQTLRLGTRGVVSGRVRFERAPQRKLIQLRAADDSSWWMQQLAEDGSFLFTNVSAGTYELELASGAALVLEPSTLHVGEDGLIDQVVRAVER